MFESKNYQEKMTETCILILVKKKKKLGLDKLKWVNYRIKFIYKMIILFLCTCNCESTTYKSESWI